MIRWTVVSVTYNSADTLRKHWQSPLPAGVEWIVVDNSSADQSADVARSLGADVIRLDTNRGFAAANNVGLRAAKGECIAFVNPDVVVDFASLFALESAVLSSETLIAPQLTNADGSLQPNGRGAPILLRKIANRTGFSRKMASNYLIYTDEGEVRYAWWITGAVVLGSAAFLRKLGGWNERFFLYHEDADLSMRAWRAGGSVRVDGDYRWIHTWARESKGFRVRPILRELSSAIKFYSREPLLLVAQGSIRYSPQSRLSGSLALDAAPPSMVDRSDSE
ncbi:glycosyltransferase [Microbacterium sp. VKM Ac-2870]|uniref:glycosyltransferase n=1 Tax=Microbacterium sp. VKM Ac-2870 TaxID=2783825 RepID=UPI00188B5870|nr:glycosyltransferase [Microbacterium sp. VKM Ac-2870]MBF4561453.1 glycosyltransferase [Microbacterium sp. VKM Ac-2870]